MARAAVCVLAATCVLAQAGYARDVRINSDHDPWCERARPRAWEVSVFYAADLRSPVEDNLCARAPVRAEAGAVFVSGFGLYLGMQSDGCGVVFTDAYVFTVRQQVVFKIIGARTCEFGMATDVAGLSAFGNCSRIYLAASCMLGDSCPLPTRAPSVEHSGIFTLTSTSTHCARSSRALHRLCNECQATRAEQLLLSAKCLLTFVVTLGEWLWRSGAAVSLVAGLWFFFR